MKKFFYIFFFIPLFLFSAPVGNPSLPSILEEGFFIPDTKAINFRVGYQIYNSQDLVMKFDEFAQQNDLNLRKIKAFSNSALITLNIKERLDLYTEIGSYRLEPVFRYESNLYNAKSKNNILCRLCAKLILVEIKDFSLGVDAKYSFFNSHLVYLTKNDKPIQDDIKFKLNEWQVAVGLSQKITILRPYIGIVYRDTKVKIENFSFFEKLNLVFKKKAGLFLGTSASLGSFVLLNAELRFINERATVISGELRF